MRLTALTTLVALAALAAFATPANAQNSPVSRQVGAGLDVCKAFLESANPAAFTASATRAGFVVEGVRGQWTAGPEGVLVEIFHFPPNSLCFVIVKRPDYPAAELTAQVEAWMGDNGFLSGPPTPSDSRQVHLSGAAVGGARYWTVEVATDRGGSKVTFQNLGL